MELEDYGGESLLELEGRHGNAESWWFGGSVGLNKVEIRGERAREEEV